MGFEKVKIARFETVDEARLLESDVLWLWKEHELRTRLAVHEMPQGGHTEVAVDTPLARSLFNRAVAAKKRGDDPRTALSLPNRKSSNKKATPSIIPRIRKLLMRTYVTGTAHYETVEIIRRHQNSLIDGWIVRNPQNRYDKNALEVHCSYGMIGHVPANVAAALAPLIKQLPNGVTVRIRVPNDLSMPLRFEKVSLRNHE